MKETHKKVTEDYQSGKLKFSDIDLTKIVEMSWKTVNKALSKFGKDLEQLEKALEGEFKNDLSALEDAGKKVGGFLGGLFGGGR